MSEVHWQKSSYTHPNGECVELSVPRGRVRDSKDPQGPTLPVDVPTLLTAIRQGRFDAP
ncbi:MAG: DUF397 domain-containing protein [Saccharopolyspora sp.]|uniref:DUF397 domain-containing protein n=1 Tax=Saccharopolyspora sp. TaxID=33915 RepID=UPI0025EAFF7C|nr:DUF397 domain-containing protein [Saccharopolyspora sp.]MBQ6644374.1 DUF397 domain-containing protein [Saccharopolyspora sp.]